MKLDVYQQPKTVDVLPGFSFKEAELVLAPDALKVDAVENAKLGEFKGDRRAQVIRKMGTNEFGRTRCFS